MDETNAVNLVQEPMEVEKVEQSNLENSGVEEVEIIGHAGIHSEANKLNETTYKMEFWVLPIEMYHFYKRRMSQEEEFLVISFRIWETILIKVMIMAILLNCQTIKMDWNYLQISHLREWVVVNSLQYLMKYFP